jgi:chemotaxis signal transduction protein
MRNVQKKLFDESIKKLHEIGRRVDDVHKKTESFFEDIQDFFPKFIESAKEENYPYLEKFSKNFFDTLKNIKGVVEAKKSISGDDMTILKFFLADSLRVLERYCEELKKGFEDRDQLIQNKNEPLKFLENWINDKNRDPNEKKESQSVSPAKKRKSLYFTFVRKTRKFAIALDQLVEVVNSKKIIELPIEQKKFAGLVSLRGEIIPIINSPYDDYAANKGKGDQTTSIIVMNIEENMVGLIADATEEVIELENEEILELETLSRDNEKSYIFFKMKEEELHFLDVEKSIAA